MKKDMKRLFSLMAALCIATGAAIAQNALVVEDFTVPQSGGEMNITLTLSEEGVYSAYQFKIDTPDGIAYAVDEENDVECVLGTGHHSSHQATAHWNPSAKELGVGVASMKSSLLEGTTVQLTIPLGATTAAVGSVWRLKLNDITFIRQAGEPDVLDDVFVNITIGEPDDGRLKFYETATALPSYTAGEKANVTMYRTIKAGQWNTIVLPFTLTKAKAEAAFGSDVELAEFAGFEAVYSDEDDVTPDAIRIDLSTYTMTAKKGMTGGKPFFIKTSRDIESFEADDCTLAAAVTDVTKADEYKTSGKFTGSLVKTTIPEDGLFLNSNKF